VDPGNLEKSSDTASRKERVSQLSSTTGSRVFQLGDTVAMGETRKRPSIRLTNKKARGPKGQRIRCKGNEALESVERKDFTRVRDRVDHRVAA